LPKEFATDFKEFCKKNHKACPVLEMLEPGKLINFMTQQAKQNQKLFVQLSPTLGFFLNFSHKQNGYWEI
jgi:uncharacterized protein YcsI (UPF0317 family)